MTLSLKEKKPVLVVDDLGCSALVDLRPFGLPEEQTVQESVAAGADIVCFSGDKLIGGAQAGIVVGKREYISRIKKHPLTRMLRVCKLTDLVLQETLRLFLKPETLVETIPSLRMITTPIETLKTRAERLKASIDAEKLPISLKIKEGESAVGGGTMPGTSLPTYVLAVKSSVCSVDRLSGLLRQSEPPVIGRIYEEELLLDTRTLLDGEDEAILRAFTNAADTIGTEESRSP